MTESQIASLVSEYALERRKAQAFARYCTTYAPVWCLGWMLFGPVTWDMSLERDPSFDGAYLTLQRRGYR